MSPWPGIVGMPVAGPTRWTSTKTVGTPSLWAYPIASCMRLKPGPDVAVNDFAPARLAPMIALALAISSSAWRNRSSGWAAAYADAAMRISLLGLIGYPAKYVAPAFIAPSSTASLPWRSRLAMVRPAS